MVSTLKRFVACPNCGKKVLWEEQNHYRPFCSERCKTIDLGAWATERYRVADDKNIDEGDEVNEVKGEG